MNTKSSINVFSPDVIFLSVGGFGFLPWAPGTWGTLISMPLPILLSIYDVQLPIILLLIVVLTIVGSWRISVVQNKFKIHDPSWIVIDELIGVMIACLFIQTPTPLSFTIAFFLFRFFDIVKIFPANYFDRMKNGISVILDDVCSGLYAGLTYLIFIKIFF